MQGSSPIYFLTTKERLNRKVLAREKTELVFDLDENKFYVLSAKTKSKTEFNQVITVNDGGVVPGADGTYTNATPIDSAFRGVQLGETFNATPIADVLTKILYPYLAPSFSSFSITGQVTPLEVGDSISSGNKNFVWATVNSGNVQANTINIIDVTGGSVTLLSASANDGTEVINLATPIQKTVAGSHVFQIQGTNTQASGFNRNYTVTWQDRMFWGFYAGTSIDSTNILLLGSSKLASGYAGNIIMPVNGGSNYLYFAYPDSWGTINTIQDITNSFNATGDFNDLGVISHTNSFGITSNYRVYRSVNMTGGASGFEYQLS